MTTTIRFSLLGVACVLALAACDARAPLPRHVPAPAIVSGEPVTGFKQCRQFFPGELPRVPDLQARQPRDLCFDAFAVLHSGRTKTPIFAVERLTAAQLADAADEERTNKFYADARLPQAERATLEDYRGSGFDRGHMQYPPSSILGYSFASEGALSRSTQPAYSVATARVWA